MPVASTTDRGFRAQYRRVAGSRPWIQRVSEEITDAIHRDLPELDADPDLRASTFTSTEGVLRLMADMVRLGRPPSTARLPPAAEEYVREFVVRRVPIDFLLRAFHVGHSTFFRNWVTGVQQELSDTEELATAVEMGASWTMDFIQAINRELVGCYNAERDLWVRSAAAIRAETVNAMLAGAPIDVATAERRLGYELSRDHLAFVVWPDDGETFDEGPAELERVAIDVGVAMEMASPLVVVLGRHLVAAWVPRKDNPKRRLSVGANRCSVAFGEPASGPAGFVISHREAMQARRVARLTGRGAGGIRYLDVAVTALASSEADLARAFVSRVLRGLAGQDDQTRRLAGTLSVYLEENASPARTAQRLGVHVNTVKNRLRSVAELLGGPPEQHVAERLVALRLARLRLPADDPASPAPGLRA